MAYSKEVIDHYKNQRNVGGVNEKDKSVGRGLVGALACGDVLKPQIKVNKEGRILMLSLKLLVVAHLLLLVLLLANG